MLLFYILEAEDTTKNGESKGLRGSTKDHRGICLYTDAIFENVGLQSVSTIYRPTFFSKSMFVYEEHVCIRRTQLARL